MKASVLYLELKRIRDEQQVHRRDVREEVLEALLARGLVQAAPGRNFFWPSDLGYDALDEAEALAGEFLRVLPIRA